MNTISLQTLDYWVIALYIISLMVIGFYVSFRKRHTQDLFLGGRSLSWPNVGLSIFGTNITPSMMLASCGIAYTSGMVAANFEWLAFMFLFLLAMVFLPYYMNTRISTMPEFIERRFNRSCKSYLSYYALFTTIVLWLGAALYPGGILMSQITGWPLWGSLLFLTAIATSFTVAGGLTAVVITDSFQSVLMILTSFVLLILGLVKVGSIDAIQSQVPATFWKLFRPSSDPEFPWHAIILGYPVIGIWFWCTDQTIVQRVLGAKNLKEGQLGAVFAAYLKILTPFLFYIPGVLCFILYPGIEDSNHAYLTLVSNLMPAGLVGLVVAILMAALVSTIDSALNSFSTVFTLDIYKNRIRPLATDRETRWIGRLTTLAIAGFGILIALAMDGVGRDLWNLIQGIIAFFAPPMASVFLIGILWRRATSRSALITLIGGSILSVGVGACQFQEWPTAEFWPHYLLLSFYLFAFLSILMIALSLITQNDPDEEKLASLRTLFKQNTDRKSLSILWIVLGAIMFIIYLIFN